MGHDHTFRMLTDAELDAVAGAGGSVASRSPALLMAKSAWIGQFETHTNANPSGANPPPPPVIF